MTGADVAQSDLGYTGDGIKVAVMDTGIDYDHPDLGGCFGDGCRVAYGFDLVGDDFNADSTDPGFNPIPTPDDDPDDCQGHGTHVAGIVGANGAVVGVAPEATLGAYRVFGCEGSTFADIMIAAMEMALADGMDVLNMSIGSTYQWPQYPTAQASDRLVNQGMVVVASIGNSGATG
jgi:subtilisin family serine protease